MKLDAKSTCKAIVLTISSGYCTTLEPVQKCHSTLFDRTPNQHFTTSLWLCTRSWLLYGAQLLLFNQIFRLRHTRIETARVNRRDKIAHLQKEWKPGRAFNCGIDGGACVSVLKLMRPPNDPITERTCNHPRPRFPLLLKVGYGTTLHGKYLCNHSSICVF